MKKLIELFLLDLQATGYNIQWVQGVYRHEEGKEYIKFYDTQTDKDLGRIEVTEENSIDLIGKNSTDPGDLIREVKYPLLDKETLHAHLDGMVKVDPSYKRYVDLIKKVDNKLEEIQKKREEPVIAYTKPKPEEPKKKLKPGESEILGREFNYNPVHVALMVDDNLWQHDKWTVIIEGQVFDFSTGIGHREVKKNKWQRGTDNWKGYSSEAEYYLKNHNWKQNKANLIEVNKKIEAFTTLKPLQIDDVLYSLIMDSSVDGMSFRDFCEEFGYDSDSRKALKIYEQCQENTAKLKTFVKDLDSARELFQDY